jgi:acyl-homoserine-lactone acylase
MKSLLIFILSFTTIQAQNFRSSELENWKNQAASVTIIRDTWGIPHIYGKTDADAVFGLMYAQCEDDFERVELNYLNACGRMAEAQGPEYLFQDLRQRLFLDTSQAKALLPSCPVWLHKLLNAFADGMNYYLATHPEVKPQLLTRFEPWMPLLFSEGSIGGDISTVSLSSLRRCYGKETDTGMMLEEEQNKIKFTGSNGFAIAPKRTINGNALLLINPHTSFYFRTEVHLSSEEGLNAYGAVTWGQFFIYQGFNEQCGWMHTSSSVDVIDKYIEKTSKKGDSLFYQYSNSIRPFTSKTVAIRVKTQTETTTREFTVYETHHGPVTEKLSNGDLITVKMMNEPVKALMQSYNRIKSTGYDSFKKNMELKTNSSNNTVYADSKGNIAYWQGNFMPKRNTEYDWTKPVKGDIAETEWEGLHALDELIHLKNPSAGWIQNCNSTPYQAAWKSSPISGTYPVYMGKDKQNYRAINAIRLLQKDTAFTLDKLIDASNDPFLPAFIKLLPALLSAGKSQTFSQSPSDLKLSEALVLLSTWNKSYDETSVPTTLAVLWGEKIVGLAGKRIPDGTDLDDIQLMQFTVENTTAEERIQALKQTLEELESDFGSWKIAWGELNRFQRITGKPIESFDDAKPSLPVASASYIWGSLAFYGSDRSTGTKKRYGTVGNSFVAVVEFGKKLKAKTIVNGGHSNNPASPHFMDQAELFCKGKFKDVWFYKEEVVKHAEQTYSPGK